MLWKLEGGNGYPDDANGSYEEDEEETEARWGHKDGERANSDWPIEVVMK